MVRAQLLRCLRWGTAAALTVMAGAAAAQLNLYEFRVERLAGMVGGQSFGGFVFDDLFDGADGGPPPIAPPLSTGTAISYFVFPDGAFNGVTETGKLPIGAVLAPNPFGGFIQNTRLLTNISSDPADALRGLRDFSAFSMTGKFDLIDPGTSAYGISFTDEVPGVLPDDVVNVTVRTFNGTLVAALRRAGNPAVPISNAPLVALGHPFIWLRLDHAAGSALVTAWYSYDGTAFSMLPDPLGQATLFHGENSTRGLFFVSSPVPEPSVYAMIFAGLALVGFIARRRTR